MWMPSHMRTGALNFFHGYVPLEFFKNGVKRTEMPYKIWALRVEILRKLHKLTIKECYNFWETCKMWVIQTEKGLES